MKKPILLTLLGCLSIASPAGAFEIYGKGDLLGQMRVDENDQREIPLNGYVGGGFESSKFSAESDLRLFRDLSRSLDDFDLYQTVLHARPNESFEFDFGRQFVNEGFSVSLIDGLKTNVFPSAPIAFSLYSGIPRTVERGDFNENDGLLTGFSARLQNTENLKVALNGAWLKQDWGIKDLEQNDEIRIGSSISYLFAGSMRPFLYSLLEYETASKTVETATLGLDLKPVDRLSATLEGNYLDANRRLSRPTILASFTEGELVSGRVSSNLSLLADRLDFYETYSLQWMEVITSDRRIGHLAEAGFLITFEEIGLAMNPAYYFAKSFGGDLHGGRLMTEKQLFSRASLEIGLDLATYDKITSDNDNATSGILWLTYEILKHWKAAGGFEYNRNNIFEQDVRGSLRVTYDFKTAI